tara:strand:- start:225 stop:1205 length:981 start_codon:yes stop_codon:yes gene_type:complete
MDDYHTDSLYESRNEWMARFVNTLIPHLNEGVVSIFKEAYKLCQDNDETEKYLMTFQNLLSRVPSWNQTIIDTETTRIIDSSRCGYLNDLLTCVHVIQLKTLTNVRVCRNQKKIDIDIPKLNVFIHKTYINIARKLYKNIYLFDQDSSPLQKQKNNREFEIIIRECIVDTIRSSIPTDRILRAYMSEKMEEEIEEEVKKEEVKKELAPIKTDSVETIKNEENTKKDEPSTPLPKKEDIVVPALPYDHKEEKETVPVVETPVVQTPPVMDTVPVVETPEVQKEIFDEIPSAVPEPVESNLVIGDDLGMEALDFDSLDIGGTININED